MKKKALSLLEVIIATIILTLTFAGLAGVFVSGKNYLVHSRARLSTGEFGKFFLDPVNLDVKHNDWNPATLDFTNRLKLTGSGALTFSGTVTQGLEIYSARYNVKVPPGMLQQDQMRKMVITIGVTEPEP